MRSHGGASGSRATGGRTVGRVERGESSRRIEPMDDDGLGRVFRWGGDAEAGEGSVAAPAGVVSCEGTGNSAFEGLSDLGVEMGLERAVERAEAEEGEVGTLLAEGEVAWMAETNEKTARRLVRERDH